MKKKVFYIFFITLILSMINFCCIFNENAQASGSTLHVGSGQTYNNIQDAIDAASNDDTIYVHSGTYNENIVVDKQIKLNGEDETSTIIEGEGTDHTITVNVSNVEISSFTIKNTGLSSSYSCIKLDAATNCKISNNTLKESGNGFYLVGNSNQNTIRDNTFEYNNIGIYFSNGDDNIVRNNIIRNNNAYGVQCSQYSTGNKIFINDFDDNNIENARDLTSNSWSYNSQGNYWDDYNNYDNDYDNIGDTPYVIDSNSQDDYPLGDFINQEQNQKPIATINQPTEKVTIIKGESINFEGEGADQDAGDTIDSYYWRSNQDGFLSSSSSFSTTSLSVNNHIIYFKVKDNHNLWSTEKSVQVTVFEQSQKPIAGITSINPVQSYYGEKIEFNGFGDVTTASYISEYEWKSNISGIISKESTFEFYNLTNGTHLISFRVKDDEGQWSNYTSTTIEVLSEFNNKPVAKINCPYQGTVGDKIFFDASQSYDTDDDSLNYSWNIGQNYTSENKTLYYTFNKPGNYTISLTVTDIHKNYSTVTSYAYITQENNNDTVNNTNNTIKNKKEEQNNSIPGFEIMILISAFLIFYFKKRKKDLGF